ncbi:MAG: sulfate adenylyltransferase subunit CysD [Planctomycetes bacterium]|nr:sulfate adenylyltransferase subunit CysD [Planctomycetota bacterium]
MDRLARLEATSIHILREAHACFRPLGMLWSMGKDSTVLLWLARRAFFGHVPFPLVHVDTSYKLPQMIEWRDRLAREWRLELIVGQNERALTDQTTYPKGTVDRRTCCHLLKSEALRVTLDGTGKRRRYDPTTDAWHEEPGGPAFHAVIAGIRADEEGSRSKERVFSARGVDNTWDVAEQPPELWNQYKTEFAPGTHVRVHPLLDWTEVDIWAYIQREEIPVLPLYFDDGSGMRYRSLGCGPCTQPFRSSAATIADILDELEQGALRRVAERSGRAQDAEAGGLEALRREGYM